MRKKVAKKSTARKKRTPARTRSMAAPDCGWCRWKWVGSLQHGDWDLLVNRCKGTCEPSRPKRKATKLNEVVKKACAHGFGAPPPSCAAHDCEWECILHPIGGYYYWNPFIPCPGGCNCPYPHWRPQADEPNAIMICEDDYRHE